MVIDARPAVFPKASSKFPEDYLEDRKELPGSLILSMVPIKVIWNKERRKNVPFVPQMDRDPFFGESLLT